MKTEYAVMKTIGGNEPEVVDIFDTYEQADRAELKMWHSLDTATEGLTVRTPEEAMRVYRQLEEAKNTSFHVAKRQVTEWEQCWGS